MQIESGKKAKIWIYVLMLLLAAGFTTQQAADYRIYVAAGRVMVDDHGNPFEDMTETEPDGIVTTHAQYRYAPIFGIALYPISLLPKQVYIFLWLFLNAFLLYKTIYLLREFFDPLKTDKKLFKYASILCLFLMVRLFGQNFELGQTTILLVFLSLYALYLARENKPVLAGFMLAIAIATKIMPLVLIAYFVYRKDFKTPIYTLLFTGLLVMIPSILVGHDYNIFLIEEWYGIINPGNDEYTLETKTGIYNLSAFVFAYLTDMPDDKIEGVRSIMSLSYETATIITYVLRALFILLTLYFLRSLPFHKASGKVQSLWEFSYILMIFPLIFPAQNKYSFYYILPAVFILAYYMTSRYLESGSIKAISWKILLPVILFFVLTTLTSSNIIGKHLYDQTQFYKIITFGMIALLAAYIQLKPTDLESAITHKKNE